MAIADTGIGIDPAAQQQIFEPYFRIASQDGYGVNSTGLGLAIVNRLVTLLQGKIDLVSELNRGSRFTVTFPRAYSESQNSDFLGVN